jgi:hypothetical protein
LFSGDLLPFGHPVCAKQHRAATVASTRWDQNEGSTKIDSLMQIDIPFFKHSQDRSYQNCARKIDRFVRRALRIQHIHNISLAQHDRDSSPNPARSLMP